jgi:hypothetical protein
MRALISAIRCVYSDCPIHAFTLTRADYAWPVDPETDGVKSGRPNASEPEHAPPPTPSEPEYALPQVPETRTMR